jgi:hypothetical protein
MGGINVRQQLIPCPHIKRSALRSASQRIVLTSERWLLNFWLGRPETQRQGRLIVIAVEIKLWRCSSYTLVAISQLKIRRSKKLEINQ